LEKRDLLAAVIHRQIKPSYLDCLYDEAVKGSFSSYRHRYSSMIFTDHPLFVDYRVLLPRNFILSRIPTFVCVNSTIDARAIAFHQLSHVRTSAIQQYGVGNLVLTFLHLFSRFQFSVSPHPQGTVINAYFMLVFSNTLRRAGRRKKPARLSTKETKPQEELWPRCGSVKNEMPVLRA